MSSTATSIDRETALMKLIRDTLGAQIRAAVAGTPIPESFVAALVANESGGNLAATRYEAAELGRFALVLAGKRESYQGIVKATLSAALRGVYTLEQGAQILVNYCTSWGPTQIMGWQALKGGYPLSELSLPTKHFPHAVELLVSFSKEFTLISDGVQTSWANFFRCWNTGRPDGKTFDPNYATNGLYRMQIYQQLV